MSLFFLSMNNLLFPRRNKLSRFFENFPRPPSFKVGKFYEIFYYDAYFAAGAAELAWMRGDIKPHVGFPEVALHAKAMLMVKAGLASIVVEQVETATAAAQRDKAQKEEAKTAAPKAKAKAKAKAVGGGGAEDEAQKGSTVQRAACEVFTPGTLVHADMVDANQHHANYLLVLRQGVLEGGSSVAASSCMTAAAVACFNFGRRSFRQSCVVVGNKRFPAALRGRGPLTFISGFCPCVARGAEVEMFLVISDVGVSAIPNIVWDFRNMERRLWKGVAARVLLGAFCRWE